MADEFFLSRWSRLKNRARQEVEQPAPPEPALAPQAVTEPAPASEPSPSDPELPPIESLTADSDFAPFMKAEVDPDLRRQALRTLFSDPRFNVMDGLDVYIDDFSKPDPIPPEWLGQLTQMARLGIYQEPEAEADGKAVDGMETSPDAVEPAMPPMAETPAAVVASDTPEALDPSPASDHLPPLRAAK
jgi:hypothetical protein